VAEKARQDLEKLYEADREAREEFVDEVGGFLPGDIWPGLAERGSRWEVREIGDGEDEEELGGRRLMEG
jgi:autophagy-related protein 17